MSQIQITNEAWQLVANARRLNRDLTIDQAVQCIQAWATLRATGGKLEGKDLNTLDIEERRLLRNALTVFARTTTRDYRSLLAELHRLEMSHQNPHAMRPAYPRNTSYGAADRAEREHIAVNGY